MIKKIKHIFALYRFKTLMLSVSPILLSHVIAWDNFGSISINILLSIVLATVLIQMGTNAYNDARDFEKGADNIENRLGPKRVTMGGLLSLKAVKIISHVTFILSIIPILYLILHGGFWIITLAIICIIAGYSYTGGIYPIAYSPTGEIFVILFFGVIAVGASYYLQTLSYSIEIFLFSLSIGMLAANVLVINNFRDMDTDKLTNKNTLAVLLGRKFMLRLFTLFHILSIAIVILISFIIKNPLLLGILFTAPICAYIIKRLYKAKIDKSINVELSLSIKYQFFFTVLICIIILY